MPIALHEFGFLRSAAVSPELRIADVSFNVARISEALHTAAQEQCDLVVFPELCLTGYSCADLFAETALRRDAWQGLQRLLPLTERYGLVAIVGLPVELYGRLFNCAAVLAHGRLCGIIPKSVLPSGGEFYEPRWFTPGSNAPADQLQWNGSTVPFGTDLLFRLEGIPGAVLAVELCEDLWAVDRPSTAHALAGATVLANLSASNEVLGKAAYRRLLVQAQSGGCIAAYIYASAGVWESTTDMVFSGHSLIAENVTILAESQRFRLDTELIIADIDIERLCNDRLRSSSFAQQRPHHPYRTISIALRERSVEDLRRPLSATPFVPESPQEQAQRAEEIFAIQTRALARRLLHVGTDTGVVVGISGGLDSTLALLVATATMDLLGWERRRVHAVSMPGPGSTERTQRNAQRLAQELGVTLHVISITAALTQHLRDIGHPEELHDATYENAQARERTQILLDLANRLHAIALGTGDLSELALGWCTYGGDHLSMYGINAGIPKTLVRFIVQWCAEHVFSGTVSEILRDICATPISPELLPPTPDGHIRQATEELLGPFEVHDFFLFHLLRYHYSPRKILLLTRLAFGERYSSKQLLDWLQLFYERFFAHQFKRSCLPDGPKVGTVALSPRGDWRMPSDATCALWLAELEQLRREAHPTA